MPFFCKRSDLYITCSARHQASLSTAQLYRLKFERQVADQNQQQSAKKFLQEIQFYSGCFKILEAIP
ncbi:MAG: hypothetical protein LBJ00_05755 [Planctomycetaceae bacterium]|nr:hypothetical protein [Planctomycetaceae bacterium]